MFSRFLREAATITHDNSLEESAIALQKIGDHWEVFANWCKQLSESVDAVDRIEECTDFLLSLADQEQSA